ncbi:MAG TPA: hypothetical protein VF002_01485 [Gaiellaceae bacterium]
MNTPTPPTRGTRIRLALALVALAAGVTAATVAILLLRTVLA